MRMNLLSRRSLLPSRRWSTSPALAAGAGRRETLAARHNCRGAISRRCCRAGSRQVLKGVRGPRGGYGLARERRRISVGEIVRTARGLERRPKPEEIGIVRLLEKVDRSGVRRAGEFMGKLDAITIEELCEEGRGRAYPRGEKAAGFYNLRLSVAHVKRI